MAMYENQGYCPNNSFGFEKIPAGDGWEEVKEVLGARTGYMVYPNGSNNYAGCYIVPMLKEGDTVARKVAYKLQAFIPECIYAKKGKKIACYDVINPYQIPIAIGVNGYSKWVLCQGLSEADNFIAENDNYLVAMKNEPEQVQIFIYKK